MDFTFVRNYYNENFILRSKIINMICFILANKVRVHFNTIQSSFMRNLDQQTKLSSPVNQFRTILTT